MPRIFAACCRPGLEVVFAAEEVVVNAGDARHGGVEFHLGHLEFGA
jgi:hypothetical protein